MSHFEDAASDLESLEQLPMDARAARPPAGEPATPMEAVRRWVAEVGIRPGPVISPPTLVLLEAFRAHARTEGWGFNDSDATTISRGVRETGVRRYTVTGGFHGYWVTQRAASLLWAYAPPGMPRKPPLPKKKVKFLPPEPELFWARGKYHAKPLVDTRGRVWPSSRVAAAHIPGGRRWAIQHAASSGMEDAHGCLWRFLSREELALIPRDALVGHVVPELAWRRMPAPCQCTRDAKR